PSRATVDAEELGALLVLADAADARAEPVPDVAALEALDPRSLDLLDAIADLDSMRAAASRLGLHHSTVQQQSAALSQSLGYDPRTPSGRVRYTLARTLQRLSHPTF
ncbi:MAG: helix-turn-helix domain-containing protein, partial [Microbacterium sp.]